MPYTGIVVQDEAPTATGGGPFTTKGGNGLLPVMKEGQPAPAEYPILSWVGVEGPPQIATGGAVSLF